MAIKNSYEIKQELMNANPSHSSQQKIRIHVRSILVNHGYHYAADCSVVVKSNKMLQNMILRRFSN